jgi:drug/metabolite transporter (DMT)-like permease
MVFKGYLCILTAGTLWGMVGPLGKLAFQEGLAPLEVAFWRAVLAWVFFGIHALIKKEVKIQRQDMINVFLFALSGVTAFYGAYQLAVNRGGAALASVLLYTAPAWVTVMSAYFFRERITPVKCTALFLTLSGVIGVSLGSGGAGTPGLSTISIPALVFGLLSGFFYSLYYIFGKHFSGRYTSPNLFFYILPIGALGLLPWVTFSPKTATAWAALICLAAFSTYGAYYFYYLGLKSLEASRASIAATIEPVVAALAAYIWWNESFLPIGYAGSILIISAVFLVVWDGKRHEKAK